jgi:signal peptidase
VIKIIYRIIKAVVTIILVATIGMLACIFFLDGYSVYIVKSDSMRPVFKSGDIVVIGSPGLPFVKDIAPGRVVSFERNHELVTHRIVSIEGDTVYTKGDAQENNDPWSVSRFFDIKGCYLFHIPYAGLASAFIKTRLGWFVCVILPALGLIGFIIKDIVKEARRCFA